MVSKFAVPRTLIRPPPPMPNPPPSLRCKSTAPTSAMAKIK